MHVDANLGAVQQTCVEIVRDTAELLGWEWDDWQGAVLTKFDRSATEQLLEILLRSFEQQWTHDTVQGSPAAAAVAQIYGGLRPGQRLLLSDSKDKPLMAGFWWPWNDGRTVSLRIKLLLDDGDPAEQERRGQ